MPSPIVNNLNPANYHQRKVFDPDNPVTSSISVLPTSVTLQRSSTVAGRPTPHATTSHLVSQTAHAFRTPANFSTPVTSSPESNRATTTSHNRSSIIEAARDDIRNLDRWPQSTLSSKGFTAHGRSNSFSRRLSFGGSGAFTFGIPSIQPPAKLQKNRPPTGGDSSRNRVVLGTPFESKSTPTLSLPPIIALATLQQSVSDLTSQQTVATTTPSTAGILSAALDQAVPDYFDRHWDQSIPQHSNQPQALFLYAAHEQSPSKVLQSAVTLAEKVVPSGSPARRHREEEGEEGRRRGHSRNRSQAGKDSSGTLSSDKSRAAKQPSQKAMLSKALQKANTAVLLDNAQNFEGAMQAYSEACNLLQQVMLRSSGDEDKRKLEAIRSTYTTRIVELEKIMPSLRGDDGKALPARPQSNGDLNGDDLRSATDEDDVAVIETATMARIVNDDSYAQQPRSISNAQLPQRRESLLHTGFDPATTRQASRTPDQSYPPRSFSRSPMKETPTGINISLAPPMDREYMPPPLSPRRPITPKVAPQAAGESQTFHVAKAQPVILSPENAVHRRVASTESMSWLDTIDESAGSMISSVHSRTSSFGVRRKHIRGTSGATEAEFDAALDAAVEAAYNDGFEPMEEPDPVPEIVDFDDEVMANVRRRVEAAKEKVRESEREAAIQLARDRERRRLMDNKNRPESMEAAYDGNESEEEERMLEEMTRGFVMDEFEFGIRSKPALPRESDSSGFSGRTWNSSIGSNPTTAATSLSTVIEKSAIPEVPPLQSKTPPPTHPPPSQALPPPPAAPPPTSRPTTAHNLPSPPIPQAPAVRPSTSQGPSTAPSQSVRSRRLSGQNPKQLKIETITKPTTRPFQLPPPLPPSQTQPLPHPPNTVTQPQIRLRQPNGGARPPPIGARQASSPFPAPSPSEALSPPTPNLVQTFNQDSENGVPRSGSPGRAQSRSGLRKNFSSSSLKNMKSRNLSVSNLEEGSDMSPNTPMSGQFGSNTSTREAKLPAMPALPTPIATAFRDKMNGATTGGLHLFQSDIKSPEPPGLASQDGPGAAITLEHCPTEALLRPFWLMRALYQTIANPRGGYLSTKLFVPRDVWRVKGVKIKYLEEKISNCDLLTAALQKLSKVDTYDADAVLEEMQALESVLDQVQAALSKRLGNEVGIQGSGVLFKDAVTPSEADAGPSGSKSSSTSGKSSFLRRLRSKNSGVGLANSYSANRTVSSDGQKESLTMSTLPMASSGTARGVSKRDIQSVQFSGPNANYMGALARLFDAAQVIDGIARQVEDPGLRHADKTQVGLELSTRHAAEFFGFYVCRFVLSDVSLLLDKFIKRGSEWVLV